MDPVRDMMLTGDTSSRLNDVISLEEGMDCRELNSRFFSLLNRESQLNIIVSKTSSLISCKLGGQEIVVDQRVYRQSHETWAISDRPYQKIDSLPWNCHVRGAELILSTSNGSSSIMYELNRQNQLNSIVKLKSIHLQSQVTYFNLKNAKQKVSIDGHTLLVQCNGNTNRIQVQPTKLLCPCNKKSTLLPQSLIGDIPCQLVQHHYNSTIEEPQSDVNGQKNQQHIAADDDIIVCDTIFSLESTCSLDVLKVKLKYANKTLIFETRSNQSGLLNGSSSANASTSVTSSFPNNNNNSARKSKMQKLDSSNTHRCSNPNLNVDIEPQTCNREMESTSQPEVVDNHSSRLDRLWFSSSSNDVKPLVNFTENCQSNITQPTTSSSKDTNGTQDNSGAVFRTSKSTLSRSHPTTILRIRVRVTNFGVCIMPIMMTNYTCSYQFVW